MKSILESCQWYRGKADPEALQQTVENSLRELTNYGEEIWSIYATILIRAWESKESLRKYTLTYTTFDLARRALMEQGSPYWEPLGNIVVMDPVVCVPNLVLPGSLGLGSRDAVDFLL
jgi:hypothetical protein